MLIGLDLDNTIIDYEAAFAKVGRRLGLLPADFQSGKRAARDLLRQGAGGDLDWQKLQAAVYGPEIGEAVAAPGVMAFLAEAQGRGMAFAIVSHKTRFAAAAPDGTDLHEAARGWLEAAGIAGRYVIPDDIHFEATRAAKLARIGGLGCGIFIDDLEEVLLDPGFPSKTIGLHLASEGFEVAPGLRSFANWDEIARAVFDGAVFETTERMPA